MKIRSWLVGAALLAFPVAAQAQVLTFEGVANLAPVANFYNGGAGGSLGIAFAPNALGLIANYAGGTGNEGDYPSGVTSIAFLSGGAATMDVFGGFSTGFSFFYSAVNVGGTVNVYSGLDATGTILASLVLPTTPDNHLIDPNCHGNNFCPFVPFGVTFSGTAHSVDFGGTANQVVFDDVTLNSNIAGTPLGTVPEPATMSLMAMGLVGMAGVARRRRKA